MTKRKISLGKQTQRFLHAKLKPLGFKHKSGAGTFTNNIDGVNFTVSIGGPSYPGWCIRTFSLSFGSNNYIQLLKDIYSSYIPDISGYILEQSIMQMLVFHPLGAIDVKEFDINSVDEAKDAADSIFDCLVSYVFNRAYAFKNPYFIEYILSIRDIMGTGNDNFLPRKLLFTKLTNAAHAETIEMEIMSKLDKWERHPQKTLYNHANGFVHYLKQLSQKDLWQKIGIDDTVDLKVEACSLFLMELDTWFGVRGPHFSEVQKLQNYIQNNKISNPVGFEKHLNSLGRRLYDRRSGAIPNALLERLDSLWTEIKPELTYQPADAKPSSASSLRVDNKPVANRNVHTERTDTAKKTDLDNSPEEEFSSLRVVLESDELLQRAQLEKHEKWWFWHRMTRVVSTISHLLKS